MSLYVYKSFTLANEAFHGGNYEDAIRYWKECFTEMGTSYHLLLYINCGAAYERSQKYTEALEMYSYALTIDPENMEALHNQGVVYTALQQPQDALRCYEKAIQIMQKKDLFSLPSSVSSSSSSSALGSSSASLLSHPLPSTGTVPTNSFYIQPLRGICMTLLTLQRYDEAVLIANQILLVHPHDPFILADKAYALMKITTTTTMDPTDTALRSIINRTDEAVRAYRTVYTLLQSIKQQQQYTSSLSWSSSSLGKLETEVRKYYGIVCSQYAVYLDQTGEFLRAEDMYNTALQLEITETRLFNRAYLYMRTPGKGIEAINEFHKVIDFTKKQDADGKNTTDKGTTNTNGSHGKEGQYAYQTYAALGTLYLQYEQYPNAFTALRTAVELGENDKHRLLSAEVYYNYGLAALCEKHLTIAKQAFEAALQLQPSMTIATKGLEQIDIVNGNTNTGSMRNTSTPNASLTKKFSTSRIATPKRSSDEEFQRGAKNLLMKKNISTDSLSSATSNESGEWKNGKRSGTATSSFDNGYTGTIEYGNEDISSEDENRSTTPMPSSRISVTIQPEILPVESTTPNTTFPSQSVLSQGMYYSNGQSTPLSFIATPTPALNHATQTTINHSSSLSVRSKRPIANHRGEKIDSPNIGGVPNYRRKSLPDIRQKDRDHPSNGSNGTTMVKITARRVSVSDGEEPNDDDSDDATEKDISLSARYRQLRTTDDNNYKDSKNEDDGDDDTIISPDNTYAYEDLRIPGPFPVKVDVTHREAYLSGKEFFLLFGIPKRTWYQQPKWKRNQQKMNVGLF